MSEKSTKKTASRQEPSVQDQLGIKRAELMELRKSHAAGELVNPRAITAMKKDIARLMTTINAQKGAN